MTGCTLCEILILFDWLCRSSKPLCSVALSDGNHNDGETNQSAPLTFMTFRFQLHKSAGDMS